MKQIGEEFIHKTYFRYLGQTEQAKGLASPPLELNYDQTQNFLQLPPPEKLEIPAIDLRTAIERRSSIRRYANTSLSLAELSFLLWCTQGVKETVRGSATLRTVPSAGARHALETYLLVNNISSLTPGLYRFVASRHGLTEINLEPGLDEALTKACLRQQFVKASAVTFIWTAVTDRMCWRYGERGYRYLLLDAGHTCQNLYLAAEAIGCGVCAIAAFLDEEVNNLLGIDGQDHFTIYLAATGKIN